MHVLLLVIAKLNSISSCICYLASHLYLHVINSDLTKMLDVLARLYTKAEVRG